MGFVLKSSAAAICPTTDSDARYRFALVAGDVYSILGELSGNRAFQHSVPVGTGAGEADADSLRAPGTLRGYVGPSNGQDYKTAYALVFGSFAHSTADSTNALAHLPPRGEATFIEHKSRSTRRPNGRHKYAQNVDTSMKTDVWSPACYLTFDT